MLNFKKTLVVLASLNVFIVPKTIRFPSQIPDGFQTVMDAFLDDAGRVILPQHEDTDRHILNKSTKGNAVLIV